MPPPGSRARGERERAGKQLSQKTMLSRALSRANMAVNLDNAQNFEAARQSYADACNLLQQVIQRTAGNEEKCKLEAIRSTYTNRIDELDQVAAQHVDDTRGKALPDRPQSDDYSASDQWLPDQREGVDRIRYYCTTQGFGHGRLLSNPCHGSARQSDMESTAKGRYMPSQGSPAWGAVQTRDDAEHMLGNSSAQNAMSSESRFHANAHGLPHVTYPIRSNFSTSTLGTSASMTRAAGESFARYDVQGPASRLGPINESKGLGSSRDQSHPPLMCASGGHERALSGNASAEFDAALDAAVEAAYDEAYEPSDGLNLDFHLNMAESDEEVPGPDRRALDTQSQRPDASSSTNQRNPLPTLPLSHRLDRTFHDFYDEDTSEEGDGETHGAIDGDVANLSVAREVANGDMNSSLAMQRPTIAALAAVPAGQLPANMGDESSIRSSSHKLPESSHPDLDTRQSTQQLSRLKIETTAKFGTPNQLVFSVSDQDPSPYVNPIQRDGALYAIAQGPGHPSRDFEMEASPSLPVTSLHEAVDFGPLVSGQTLAHESQSSSSLQSIGDRKMSLVTYDDSDLSPGTPSNNPFNANIGRDWAPPSFLTPIVAALHSTDFGQASGVITGADNTVGGMHLFDDTIHAPQTPGTPLPTVPGGPVPLEPCPTEFTFRPFWLMRCLYQTLAHPNGGYLSTRLFVPRDVWKVKGVKLKNVEDKIASCDLLTAALLKLARVDNNDADALLEEMQALEAVLDQVQSNLTRRLGSEVGPQALGILGSGTTDAEPPNSMPRSSSVSSKSSSFSWKRLRSKNSAAILGAPAAASKTNGNETITDSLSLSSLPMTPNSTRRPPKRDFNQVQFSGPNASYMSSLARLFDAVQAIDQIARQVDDPGLRHADQTQVGLELSTRRAAEFFGFYICRFVLSDVGILLDKFIKRGSELVVA